MRNQRGQFVRGSIEGFPKGHSGFRSKQSYLTFDKSHFDSQEYHQHLREARKKRLPPVPKGTKLSEEHKAKISASLEGHSRGGWKISERGRRNMSLSKRGVLSYLWEGGKTEKNALIRQGLEYRLWREAVFKRDGYTCVIGGKSHGSRLQADHIKPFAYFPELRFVVSNGRTLCIPCHKATPTYGRPSQTLRALYGIMIVEN